MDDEVVQREGEEVVSEVVVVEVEMEVKEVGVLKEVVVEEEVEQEATVADFHEKRASVG